MTKIKQEICCGECGRHLPSEWISNPGASQPCDKCGSDKQHIKIEVNEESAVEVHDQMKAKLKDDSFPSKKKIRKEVIAGDDHRKSRGDWVEKERVIDRDNDLYIEKVVDKDTGEVIREVRESLSEHQGRGSAKMKE